MWPGASVSGLYFAHPEAKYFAVGKLERDQLLDYHLRKQMDLRAIERWLGPNLNYDPDRPVSGSAPAKSNPQSSASGCSCGHPHSFVGLVK
jgi:5-methyltetrahydrofolate--homocysteine methyltransferase